MLLIFIKLYQNSTLWHKGVKAAIRRRLLTAKLTAPAEGEYAYFTIFTECPLCRMFIAYYFFSINAQIVFLKFTSVRKKYRKYEKVCHKCSIIDIRIRSILVHTPY